MTPGSTNTLRRNSQCQCSASNRPMHCSGQASTQGTQCSITGFNAGHTIFYSILCSLATTGGGARLAWSLTVLT